MRRSIWLAVAIVVAVLAIPTAAHGSCSEPIPLPDALADAPIVFVGTVTGLDYQDRVATVAVDEVWKGDAGAVATVSGGGPVASLEQARQQGLETFTSVDRTFVSGERYLFLPYAMEQGAFMDTQCSNTQIYGADLDAFRPADARIPAPTSGGGSPAAWIGAGAVAALAVVLAVLVGLNRSRSGGDPSRRGRLAARAR